ncbi:MAG TPA: HEAT repeat domain-containing protein [Acidimicrobiales bacterium]|nr:HEAT repeat domain-containing protein [Acidimicrobiales bacterium]
MSSDPSTFDPPGGAAAWRQRRRAALAGHGGDEATARRLLADPSAGVRATSLGALARIGALTPGDVAAALADPDATVRRRACEVAVAHEVDLVPLLSDEDPSVAETAAWALGEGGGAGGPGPVEDPRAEVVDALSAMATGHHDPLCREAAVAALGAVGDERGLPAILAATSDKPAVRRRAVIALAPFEGAEVQVALERARADRDWQVRQAAEDLLAADDGGGSGGGGAGAW